MCVWNVQVCKVWSVMYFVSNGYTIFTKLGDQLKPSNPAYPLNIKSILPGKQISFFLFFYFHFSILASFTVPKLIWKDEHIGHPLLRHMAISVNLIPVLQISTQYKYSIYCQSAASVQVLDKQRAIWAPYLLAVCRSTNILSSWAFHMHKYLAIPWFFMSHKLPLWMCIRKKKQ